MFHCLLLVTCSDLKTSALYGVSACTKNPQSTHKQEYQKNPIQLVTKNAFCLPNQINHLSRYNATKDRK